MGVIQNAINQTLGIASVTARLSPGLEERAKRFAAKKEEGKLMETTKKLSEEVPDIAERIKSEAALDLPEKRIKNIKEQQELGLRTPGNAAKVIQNEQIGMEIAQGLKDKKYTIKPMTTQDFLKMRQQQAMKKTADIQGAELNQKQNFKKYPEDLKKTIDLLKGRDITNDK